jgi:DNA repair ATPase RecN
MTKIYTYEDIPNTLNSISWQLKRIADQLENINSNISEEADNQNLIDMPKQLSKLREMMKSHDIPTKL